MPSYGTVLKHKGAVQPPRFVWDADTFGKQNWHRDSEDLEAWTSTTNMTVSNAAATIALANGQQVELALLTGDATVAVHSIIENAHFGDGAPDPSLFPVTRRNSLYVKAGTARYVVVSSRLINGAGGTQYQSIWDFQTEAWVYEGTFYTNHGFESLGDGAYRLWFNDPVNSTAYGESTIGLTSGDTVFDSIYDATGETVYAGGWQIEFIAGDLAGGPTYYAKTQGKTADQTDPTIIRQRVRSTAAYTSPAKDNTNYVDLSEDMANWASKSTTNTPTNKYLTINGKRIPIDNCDDTSAAGYYNSQVYNYIPISPGDEVHFSLFCLKDAIPATTRHPMIRAQFSNGSSRGYDINWTTDMGVAATANVTFTNWGVEEKIDDNGTEYLHVWGSIADDVANNNTAFKLQFYPAVGNSATLTNYSVTGVGSCDVGGWIMNPGAITEAPEYFGPTTGPKTDGTPDYFYDNGVTPNVIYMFKSAVQLTKLALERRVQLVRSRTAFLLRGLVRNLIN